MTVPESAYEPEQRVVILHTDNMPRCHRCNRKLAEFVSRPWRLVCTRCKAVNQAGVVEDH